MLVLRPIDEPEIIALLNAGRFAGEVEGYVMTDGAAYLGHALFRVEDGVTALLDSSVEDRHLLDGISRACIAAGQNRGARHFTVNRAHPPLAAWCGAVCGEAGAGAEGIYCADKVVGGPGLACDMAGGKIKPARVLVKARAK